MILKKNISISTLTIILLFDCIRIYGQNKTQLITLNGVINTLSLVSPAARIEKLNFQNKDLEFENYKKSYLPAIALNINHINFNRSLRVLQQPTDGSYSHVEDYSNNSDMGIIASLQEQSSYVAIEMTMFGLPIITTAVDGLDETFTDGINALKVNTIFSPVFGLSADVEMLVEKIVLLIESSELKSYLSNNVRKIYEQELHLNLMLERKIDVYNSLLKI